MAGGTKGGTPPAQPPVSDNVKTGGGGGDDGESQVATSTTEQGEQEQQLIVKRRKDLVTAGADNDSRLEGVDWSFRPDSLLGSWFHRLEGGAMVWQGVIVGELASREGIVYLCQIDQLAPGAKQVQRLVKFDDMIVDDDENDWRFYDNEVDARSAYAEWVATERERV